MSRSRGRDACPRPSRSCAHGPSPSPKPSPRDLGVLRSPAPPLDEGGKTLKDALLEYVQTVGAKGSLNLGWYHHLTKDKAVHAPSMTKDPEMVGRRGPAGSRASGVER